MIITAFLSSLYSEVLENYGYGQLSFTHLSKITLITHQELATSQYGIIPPFLKSDFEVEKWKTILDQSVIFPLSDKSRCFDNSCCEY